MAVNREQAEAPLPKTQFFKILLPCFLQRLRLPERFNKCIMAEMPRKATILSPLGGPWIVEVFSDNNFLYFGEGWQEFSQAHGLDVGYLVLFTYEGDMVFDVTIFDRTTCMKEYIPAEEGNKKDDNSHCNVVGKPAGRPRPQDALHERSLAEILGSTDSQNHNAKLAWACKEGSQFEINISSHNPSEEPDLLLPPLFVKYLSEKKGRLATIFSPTGKAWHIKVHEDGKGFHFADGWQKFAQAHNLRRGDLLAFRHNGDLLFDVTILDNSIGKAECNLEVANARIPTEEETSEKGLEELLMPLYVKPTNAQDGESAEHGSYEAAPGIVNGSASMLHFELVINLSTPYRRRAFEFPAKFMASNGLTHIKQFLLRDPNGQLWPLRVSRRRTHHRFTAYSRWQDFCIGNNLQDGDVCLFQLKGKAELHVQIRRRRHQKSMKDVSRDSRMKSERLLPRQSAAGLGKSERHHHQVQQFTCTMSRGYYYQGQVHIPSAFVSSLDLSSTHQVTLVDTTARLWPVKLYHWKAGMSSRATIAGGWKAFCIGNSVKLGDKCIFKPASKVKNDVFHVSVIKRKAMDRKQMSGS